jgi:toxin ParE1/3/4
MAKVVFRQKAIDDLSSIWIYTFHKWSENQANKYYQDIENACLQLDKKPNIGKQYSEINNNLFGFECGKHIIFY